MELINYKLMAKLSHINRENLPEMVGVSEKSITLRRARARAQLRVTDEIMAQIEGSEMSSKKGPVFQTAVLAGVMAAKRTHELVPLCHPVPLEYCKIEVNVGEENRVVIECKVQATHKTGVEMEALTGASVAALTVYDMCKSLSHEIVIESVRLMEKTGGKRDFNVEDVAKS